MTGAGATQQVAHPTALERRDGRTCHAHEEGLRPFHIYRDPQRTWWTWMDEERAGIIKRLAGNGAQLD